MNNRARLRRRFCHLLEDLAVLHAEAEELDESLAVPSPNKVIFVSFITILCLSR
jgi:hypothetical protein